MNTKYTRSPIESLACVAPECDLYGRAGQDNLTSCKVYGGDQIHYLRCYLKERGLVEEVGDHVRVGFAEREGNKPIIKAFDQDVEELTWLCQEITRLVKEEQVRPEDILLLFYGRAQFDYARLERLLQAQLPDLNFVHPFGDLEDKRTYIFQPGSLTVSTVHGAKGYDAPIVFVLGADRFDCTKEGRAAFYVACTRAKMLLHITGLHRPNTLLWEADAVWNVL
jgi:superfamily I DNA/RNA helicase